MLPFSEKTFFRDKGLFVRTNNENEVSLHEQLIPYYKY